MKTILIHFTHNKQAAVIFTISLGLLSGCYRSPPIPTQSLIQNKAEGQTALPPTIESYSAFASSSQTIIKTTDIPPTPNPSPTSEIGTTEPGNDSRLTIHVVYDNNPFDPMLETSWGFAAWVKYRQNTLLFDTGGDGDMLLRNMARLGLEPHKIQGVVLSHAHVDHSGSLLTLLSTGIKPSVYMLPSFPSGFKRQTSQLTEMIEATSFQPLGDGLFTTGELGTQIPEQTLVIDNEQGLVVITGCAHPGIVSILELVAGTFQKPVKLVLGGVSLEQQKPGGDQPYHYPLPTAWRATGSAVPLQW